MSHDRTLLDDERLLGALDVVLETGALQRESLDEDVVVEYKSRGELVTEVDSRSQERIVAHLRREFPTHGVLAEEGATADDRRRCRWIVDPLDGTTNYYHGFPTFSISVALEVDGTLELGIVYDVPGDDVYTGIRGSGAFRERTPITVSEESALERSLVGTGFDVDTTPSVETLAAIVETTQGVRRTGSAALDLIHVATGRTEGFYQGGLSPWDVAAGAVIVREAGGRITDYGGTGGLAGLESGDIVASNGLVHDALRNRVR
ncbi:inositol monophosphatase family protein [Halomicroarcula sp. GCM10025709]|uniref:inositol monophosphatase family protein n=1 Tax=Haloarcula TaxID=2237 RepID=UPI0024C21C19|nr:inositol monophosphatase family protein [Halomicroarcula sp. YJ-61-S]